jgi:ABC-type enterochelin transport system permease subunit
MVSSANEKNDLFGTILCIGAVLVSGLGRLSLQTFVNNAFICPFVSGCEVAYFLFSEGKEIFFNSILSAWERWKLFYKLWSVLGLVLMLLNCLLIVLLASIPCQLLFVVCLVDNPICLVSALQAP